MLQSIVSCVERANITTNNDEIAYIFPMLNWLIVWMQITKEEMVGNL